MARFKGILGQLIQKIYLFWALTVSLSFFELFTSYLQREKYPVKRRTQHAQSPRQIKTKENQLQHDTTTICTTHYGKIIWGSHSCLQQKRKLLTAHRDTSTALFRNIKHEERCHPDYWQFSCLNYTILQQEYADCVDEQVAGNITSHSRKQQYIMALWILSSFSK